MVLPHTTSKLRTMEDMESLATYGFRGEALSSLCQVSQLSIVTRHETEHVASRTVFNVECGPVSCEQCAGKQGTEVTAANLFHNLPVRRNYYKNTNRRKEELDKVKKLVYSFAIVNPTVRLSLYHEKVNLWSSLGSGNMLDNVALVIGRKESKHLLHFNHYLDTYNGDISADTHIRISGLLPNILSSGSALELGRSNKDFTWIFVNRRPVEFKEIEKLLKVSFSEACSLDTPKFPVCVISIEMFEDMRHKVDPNLEPNKQKVGLSCKQVVLTGIENILKKHWPRDICEDSLENVNTSVNEIVDDSYNELLNKEPEQKLAFTHIGETQENCGEEKKFVSERKFNENSYGMSQYFTTSKVHSVSTDVSKISNVVTPSGDNSKDDSLLTTKYSPVLKAAMFESPELPGVDAVYVNRLKDGDFPEPKETEVNDMELLDKSESRPRNPFIQYECEEEDESPLKENEINTPNTSSVSASKSTPFKAFQLTAPSVSKQVKTTPSTKRKFEPDESITRIDAFLEKRKCPEAIKRRPPEPEEMPLISDSQQNGPKHSRRRVNVSFSLDSCAEDSDKEPRSSVACRFMSGWIVKDESELSLLYPPRLREMILYERLLSGHVMPSEKIEPVTLWPGGVLAESQARTLVNMHTNLRRCPAKITDRRLGHNGFMVGLYPIVVDHSVDSGGDNLASVTLRLETRCPLIPYYGVDDLVEILGHVGSSTLDSVRVSRPAKVKEYLAGEASRLAADMPPDLDREAVEELMLARKDVLGAKVTSCIHGKPIFRSLVCHQSKDD